MKRFIIIVVLLTLLLSGCRWIGSTDSPQGGNNTIAIQPTITGTVNLKNAAGVDIQSRFSPPPGYERIAADEHSFTYYLRHLKLKPDGSSVLLYDGNIKQNQVYEAVIDMEIGKENLQQCADATIRLRAEYLYIQGRYEDIHFNFTSGFRCDYSKWAEGWRVKVKNDNVQWVKTAEPSYDYAVFRKYLDIVFMYAGSYSLSKELKHVAIEDMQPGDVFVIGGFPGHCEIVVDMAQDPKTGRKAFMLAQSYMPAQDIHVLKNDYSHYSPWYPLDFGDELLTPEYSFSKNDLMRYE